MVLLMMTGVWCTAKQFELLSVIFDPPAVFTQGKIIITIIPGNMQDNILTAIIYGKAIAKVHSGHLNAYRFVPSASQLIVQIIEVT